MMLLTRPSPLRRAFLSVLLVGVVAMLAGCPTPSPPRHKVPAPALVESDDSSPASPTAYAPSSRVAHDEDQITSLSDATRRLEEALLKGSVEDVAQLAHPERRQDFARALGEVADAMPDLGRGLTHRELISLDAVQALYTVFVPGFGEYLVEFLSSDDTWWLTLWIPF